MQSAMMDWDKLRVFHAVAEAGSFTHAGEILNLSQSAVSRQISALEELLGVPLFHRHARGLILTEQGELLYRTAREVFAKLAITKSMLQESKEHPKGALRVTTPFSFGSTWLAPRVREFLEQYPDIKLTLLIADNDLDLGMREADVAIRMQPARQPDLVQRQLLTFRSHIYAASSYIERRGLPQSVDELRNHFLITHPPDTNTPFSDDNWLMQVAGVTPENHPEVLQVDNMFATFRAVQSGLGLAALPDYMVADRPNLVRILPDVAGPEVKAYFVYAEELRQSKRIIVFRDFLLEQVQNTDF